MFSCEFCGPFKNTFFKHEKHPWRSATFSKSYILPWVLFMFFKLYKWHQFVQSVPCFVASTRDLRRSVATKFGLNFSNVFKQGTNALILSYSLSSN